MNIESLLSRADALKAEIDAMRPLDADKERRVWQKFALDWNYHSNAIEGNKVTLGETEMFLQYGLTAKGKPFKDYVEIRGHARAIEILRDLVRRNDPVTEGVIRELHKAVLGEAQQIDAETPEGLPTTKLMIPGEYKTQPNHVKTPGGGLHYYVEPLDTPAEMGKLVAWWREQWDRKALHPALIAARVHHRFTEIHPFDDGNGRMARLLSNLILMQAGFPPAVIKNEQRDEYIFALRAADQGDLVALTEMLLRELIHSQELLLKGAKGESVTELDDLDKEISLLKQELQHIGEPVELSVESGQEAWESTVRPAIAAIMAKYSRFDDLFRGNSIHVEGAIGPGADHWRPEESKITKETAANALSKLFVQRKLPRRFTITCSWKDFRKTPTAPLSMSATIQCEFESLRYVLTVANRKTVFKYGVPLSSSQLTGLLEMACRPLLNEIQTHVKRNGPDEKAEG